MTVNHGFLVDDDSIQLSVDFHHNLIMSVDDQLSHYMITTYIN